MVTQSQRGFLSSRVHWRKGIKKPRQIAEVKECDPAGARTQDPLLKREMLYQLSYRIIKFSLVN